MKANPSSSSPPTPAARPSVPPAGPTPDGGSFVARYRELVLAGGLLGFLVLAIFGLNLQVMRQLESDAFRINLAARQRALTQRIAKDALQLRSLPAGSTQAPALMDDLRQSDDQLRSTQAATTSGPSRQKALDAAALWQPVQDAVARVLSAPGNTPVPADVEDLVTKVMERNLPTYLALDDLANALTDESRSRAARLRWTQAAAVALVLGLFGYIGYLFAGKLRRNDARQRAADDGLRESNARLEASTARMNGLLDENALILATVKQGLLVIDPKYRIGNTYSKECEHMLRVEGLAGMDFLGLLQRGLTEKMYGTTRDYLELMFNPAKKEKQLAKINPLREVEVHFAGQEGGFDTRHLEFEFRRVMAGKDVVARLFVSVRDVTEQVQLQRQLREAEQRKDRQFEILSSVLHVEPDQFREFLDAADQELRRVTETLRADSLAEVARGADGQEGLRKRLNGIFQAAHSIKGNAEFIGARYFVQSVHDFEEKIRELRDRPNLQPEDLLSMVMLQASLVTDLEEARGLLGRLGNLRGYVSPRADAPTGAPAPAHPATSPSGSPPPPPVPAANAAPIPAGPGSPTRPAPEATPSMVPTSPSPPEPASTPTPPSTPPLPAAAPLPPSVRPGDAPGDGLAGSFQAMMQHLATTLGKQVQVMMDGFPEDRLGPHQDLVRDVLIQLGRNSLAHGIEAPVERLARGKPLRGRVSVQATVDDDGGLRLTFRDDGRGLDPMQIRTRSLHLKLASAAELSAMDDGEVALMIFEPGFSTTEKANKVAGRGVGLDLLRQRVLEDLGGEILVDSQTGRFCEFQVVLPPPSRVHTTPFQAP